MGTKKNLIVLTREVEYQKHASSREARLTAKLIQKKYPRIAMIIRERHIQYNRTVALCNQLEREGKAVLLRPTTATNVGRMEKDIVKLRRLYQAGYCDAEKRLSEIRELFFH